MASSDVKGISVIQVDGIHGGRLSLDTVLMSVEEGGDGTGAEEEIGLGIVWDDAVLFVEL